MKIKAACKITLYCLLVSFKAQAGFFDEKAQGWHWYKDISKEEYKEEQEIAQQPNAVKDMTPTEIVNAYKKELESRLHKAWVSPNHKNMLAYQEMQKDLMQRSQGFSNSWMQVLYQNPHLDHTLVSPVNQVGRHIYLDQEKDKIREKISSLKNNYGLFFFFSSQCAYCHQFAPIVKRFSEQYGWEVIVISADGGQLAEFNNVLPDNGLIARWKVDVFPALFAINPITEDIVPVAFGLTTIDEMETRIMNLINE